MPQYQSFCIRRLSVACKFEQFLACPYMCPRFLIPVDYYCMLFSNLKTAVYHRMPNNPLQPFLLMCSHIRRNMLRSVTQIASIHQFRMHNSNVNKQDSRQYSYMRSVHLRRHAVTLYHVFPKILNVS